MTDATDYVPPKVWTWNKAERRPVRQHQPADRRADPRQGIARRPPSAAALLARHAERRQSHDHARRAAGARAQRRRIRRLADRDRQWRSVRQRFRRDQPELQDPGHGGSQRADADPNLRIRRDPGIPRREVRGVPAHRGRPSRGMPFVALLADGRRALSSAAGSDISTPTPRPRSNMRSIVTPWK